MPNPKKEDLNDKEHAVISPFATTVSKVDSTSKERYFSWPFWVVSGLLVCVVLGIICYFSFKYLSNPYRTLEPFPVDKYLADYQPLAGSKFKADFKVVADLGWKDGIGRLMVFSVQNDTRPIPVLIPPKLSGMFFTKDQVYQISLEVGEGGLIYANSCEKE